MSDSFSKKIKIRSRIGRLKSVLFGENAHFGERFFFASFVKKNVQNPIPYRTVFYMLIRDRVFIFSKTVRHGIGFFLKKNRSDTGSDFEHIFGESTWFFWKKRIPEFFSKNFKKVYRHGIGFWICQKSVRYGIGFWTHFFEKNEKKMKKKRIDTGSDFEKN